MGVEKKPHPEEKGAFRMRLYAEGRPDVVDFKVMSRYKYKQIGEPVVYEDHVCFYNSETSMYLHMSTTRDFKPINNI